MKLQRCEDHMWEGVSKEGMVIQSGWRYPWIFGNPYAWEKWSAFQGGTRLFKWGSVARQRDLIESCCLWACEPWREQKGWRDVEGHRFLSLLLSLKEERATQHTPLRRWGWEADNSPTQASSSNQLYQRIEHCFQSRSTTTTALHPLGQRPGAMRNQHGWLRSPRNA